MSLLVLGLLCGTVAAQSTGTRPHRGTERYNTIWVKSFTQGPANQFVTGWNPLTGTPQWAQPSTSMLVDGSSLLRTTGAQKVTGLQVVPRECAVVITASTAAFPIDNCDDFVMNTLGANVTFDQPTGTGGNPACGQQFSVRIKSTAQRTISHHAIYSANVSISLPTTTTGNGTTYDLYLYRYNCDELKWQIIANSQIPTAEITIAEIDGTPSGPVNSLKINNGTLAIAGKEATITFPSGGGGGTGTVQLPITGVQLSGLGGAPPAVIDSALNNRALVFNSTIDQCVIWDFVIPADYTGAPVWKFWYGKQDDVTASNSVRFDVSVMKLLTTASVETDVYSTINNCTDTTTPTATHRLDTELGNSCTLTNFATAVAGNAIKLKVCHNSSDGVTGLVRLYRAAFTYAK